VLNNVADDDDDDDATVTVILVPRLCALHPDASVTEVSVYTYVPEASTPVDIADPPV
jgi:hypothetical protein